MLIGQRVTSKASLRRQQFSSLAQLLALLQGRIILVSQNRRRDWIKGFVLLRPTEPDHRVAVAQGSVMRDQLVRALLQFDQRAGCGGQILSGAFQHGFAVKQQLKRAAAAGAEGVLVADFKIQETVEGGAKRPGPNEGS